MTRKTSKLLVLAMLFVFFNLASTMKASADKSEERTGISDKEILIGSCLPLSGILHARARVIADGANAYFAYINERGGINGRKIKLVVCDDAYDPEKAINCFNSCLKDKTFAGAFFLGSSVITKYVRMADVTGMPLIGFNVAPPILCDRHASLFNLRPCYRAEVAEQIQQLWKHHLRNIAILYQSDALGAGLRQAAVDELKTLNASPVAEASFSHTGDGVNDAYRRIKAARPSAVVVAGAAGALKTIIKDRSSDRLPAVFVAISSLGDAVLEEGTTSDGIVITQVLPPLNAPMPTIELYKQTLKKYDPASRPHEHGLEAFLNAMVLVEGLKGAGADLTRTKLISAIESLRDFNLGLDEAHAASFRPGNHTGWSSKVIGFYIVRAGKLVPMTEADWQAAGSAMLPSSAGPLATLKVCSAVCK